MTSEQRTELERLASQLPVGGDLFRRTKLSVLRARMQGLLDGVSSGECMGGAWSVCDSDADGLIRLANKAIADLTEQPLDCLPPQIKFKDYPMVMADGRKVVPMIQCPRCKKRMVDLHCANCNITLKFGDNA